MTHPAAAVMLAVQEKKTSAVDLYRPLRNYIAATFGEREAQLAEDDLQTVQQLRGDLFSRHPPDTSSLDLRRDLLVSYARALAAIEPRFLISDDRDHVHISFTWHDAFKPSKKAAAASIHFEKAAVLFNLGAVYSQIALAADRSSAAGLKVACNNFQSAAGAFAFLKEQAASKATAAGATLDTSVECAGMLEKLMLAQAQACFYEKVIGDAKPPGLCSKVARQVALYYEEAYLIITVSPLNQHLDRMWLTHVQFKVVQFNAEACYRYSLELHQKEEIAEEIARLKIALSAIGDARKIPKAVAQPVLDAINKLETNMNQNLERAQKENDRVYLMRIPATSSLSVLPAASLVKSTPLREVLEAGKERLFINLVPDTSTKALSKYTDMLDNVIRTQAEKLQQASEIARVRLKEMELPDSILALEGNLSLPLDLKEDVEAVQISGGPSGLESELQQLRDLRRVNQELLVQTEEILQKEANEDAQFRTQFGARWTRPQSSTLTKNLQDRLNKFAGNLKQAAESDAKIEHAVIENSELMSILEHRPIESALPSLAQPLMSLDGNEGAMVGVLKQSLRQLESLGTERASLEDMLKEMKRKDDILPKLMSLSGSQEDLFKKEISKYDQICEEIDHNIQAQEQLLLQIQSQNNEFAALFNVDDYKVARERSYRQIVAAIAKYREIKEHINEGMKFYVTLQDAVNNIKQQCSDFAMTRSMQCQDMIDDVQRQVAGLSLGADGRKGYNYPPGGQSNTPRNNQHIETQSNPLPSRPPPPYHHPGEQLTSAYSQPYPPGGPRNNQHLETQSNPLSSRPRPPYQHPAEQPTSAYSRPYPPPYAAPQQHTPYNVPGSQYHHRQQQQQQQQPQQPPVHNYGQPAYPGWRGPYYNPNQQQQQQPGVNRLPPPYNSMPSPYPPNQGSYYRPQ